jgi:hypothetical protein
MEEDETCPAGSTLVLKIDGTKVRTEREGQEFSKKRTRGRNLGKYTMIKLFLGGGGSYTPMNGRHSYEALDMDRELFPRKGLGGASCGTRYLGTTIKKKPNFSFTKK